MGLWVWGWGWGCGGEGENAVLGLVLVSLLDQLRSLEVTQLDNVLGEILNINRINVSALGTAKLDTGENPAKRNIIA